jgi:hypothetical protein
LQAAVLEGGAPEIALESAAENERSTSRASSGGRPLVLRRTEMRKRWTWWVVVAVAALAPLAASADDVTNQSRILCASTEATVCTFEGECEIGAPWTWNIPSFVVIDLDAKTIATTGAASEKRQTSFTQVASDDEHVVLQGYENGRAFSFVIHLPTGELSVAVARDGIAVSVFGMCTTFEPGKR